MTAQELALELNTCLSTAAQEKQEFREGLDHFAKQIKAARKDLLKMLKKETSKPKRKLLKKDLRKVELAYQSFQ